MRVGNWVLIDFDGAQEPRQIEGIVLASDNKRFEGFGQPMLVYSEGCCVINDENEPYIELISLTPEILETAGFSKHGTKNI